MPDPVDADPAKTSASRRAADIISMLVNIYGSKELFVNEYRSLLSNRLLSQFSYDTDKEIRNLELLKLRFGDAPLHQCEVMLKDVGDSKRINTNLHSFKTEDAAAIPANDIPNDENAPTNATANEANKALSEQPFPVNAIVLSAQFWKGSIERKIHFELMQLIICINANCDGHFVVRTPLICTFRFLPKCLKNLYISNSLISKKLSPPFPLISAADLLRSSARTLFCPIEPPLLSGLSSKKTRCVSQRRSPPALTCTLGHSRR